MRLGTGGVEEALLQFHRHGSLGHGSMIVDAAVIP
jgi:hypothetical protein